MADLATVVARHRHGQLAVASQKATEALKQARDAERNALYGQSTHYRIAQLSIYGLGLFAEQNLQRGDLVLHETALLQPPLELDIIDSTGNILPPHWQKSPSPISADETISARNIMNHNLYDYVSITTSQHLRDALKTHIIEILTVSADEDRRLLKLAASAFRDRTHHPTNEHAAVLLERGSECIRGRQRMHVIEGNKCT